MLSGCMQNLRGHNTRILPRDNEMLAKVSYAKVAVPEPPAARSSIITARGPGSIAWSHNHYPITQPGGKTIRYGITVGEEAMAWFGIAKVGSKTSGRPGIRRPAKSRVSAFRNS